MTAAVVLDASVAMTWFYPDENSGFAYRVLDLLESTAALVPSLWSVEVANAILVGERRHRLSTAEVTRFLELLSSLSLQVDEATAQQAFSHTLPLARAHRLSTYDAAYLELAMREDVAIATLDDKLRSAAKTVGVEVLA